MNENSALMKSPTREFAAVHREDDRRKIRFAHQRRDQRRDQVLDQGGDHRAERGAHYHGYRQIQDVSSQHELFEALHGPSLLSRWNLVCWTTGPRLQAPERRNLASRSMAGSRMARSAA